MIYEHGFSVAQRHFIILKSVEKQNDENEGGLNEWKMKLKNFFVKPQMIEKYNDFAKK